MTTREVRLDRRTFIAGGAAAAVAISPLAQAVAAALPAAPSNAGAPHAILDDWTIDDMWGVHPRPHEPIGFGRPRGDGELMAGVAPADEPFLV